MLDEPTTDETAEVGQAIPVVEIEKPKQIGAGYWISWLAILSVVLLISIAVGYSQFMTPKSYEASAIEMMQFNLMSKMAIGFQQPDDQQLGYINTLKDGPYEQRLAYAIMLQEIKGPEEAIERLNEIDESVQAEQQRLNEQSTEEEIEFPNESQQKLREIVGQLFRQYSEGDYENSQLAAEDRELLATKFGWVGEIAVTPGESPNKTLRSDLEQEAVRTFVVAIIIFIFGGLIILAAFGALAMVFGMMMLEQIYARYRNSGKHAQIYIETFAIWLVLFFGLQIGLSLIGSVVGSAVFSMALTLIAFFASLGVLIWPVRRGIPFSQVRKDIGWEFCNPFEEFVVGCFSYLALVVPMIGGLVITAILGAGLGLADISSEFQSAAPAGHPIAEEIASGEPIGWLLIFLSACVAAPIVEETMFRGVLYRSLRESTGRRFVKTFSVAFSAIFGGLIFAMIHPQGIVGVPVLTTLAIGFSLVREWRSSLIGPMVMHAINNSMVTCVILLLFTR